MIRYKIALTIIRIGWRLLPEDTREEVLALLGIAGRKGIF